MHNSNRQFILRSRPSHRIGSGTFELVDSEIPDIADGDALVKVCWISLDPSNRRWLNDTPGYLPSVAIGEVMRGFGLGRVVASRHPGYREGQLVRGLVGWREWAVASDATPLMLVQQPAGLPESTLLGVLGFPGLTAWVGLEDIGRPVPGETVVVSAAAGAVGSVAAQVAKIRGARVVGFASGSDKCTLLTDRLGLDVAIDRTAPDWREQLIAATPDGVDVDFENVGGEIMDAVFARVNLRARVVLCGQISSSNDPGPPPGPRNFSRLLVQRVLLQGLIALDHVERFPQATSDLSGWMREGTLEQLQTVVDGFEQLPTAINMLFDGSNIGKLLVRVADS